ncbi:hypothetical protein [Nocardiopsis baichengensis]|uniref:hypothetical protein n=1 Tax=Nocardiopsis baichengensis TaxID=280240 RepID=UPI00034B901D|nr:hypothetical protein [Nocardiopsis baichengensis]
MTPDASPPPADEGPREAPDAAVAATVDHLRGVLAVLRELDLADTPPAAAYDPAAHTEPQEEPPGAAL